MSDIQLDADLEAVSAISDLEVGDTVVLYATVDKNNGGLISLSITDAQPDMEDEVEEEEMPPEKPKKPASRARAAFMEEDDDDE